MTGARPFALFLAVLSLPGCAGVVVFRTRLGEFNLEGAGDDRSQLWTSLVTEAPPTASALERTWGKPDRIGREGADTEIWTYRNGLRWNGVILVVFLPLPLIAPVGWDHVTFRIQGGRVVWITVAVEEETSYICGLLNAHGAFGCRASVDLRPPRRGYLYLHGGWHRWLSGGSGRPCSVPRRSPMNWERNGRAGCSESAL